jgi:ABC-type transport system involved in cytochrome bd biosynthesis fused ATPase/permease subunit
VTAGLRRQGEVAHALQCRGGVVDEVRSIFFPGGIPMLWTIAVILFVLWLLGFFAFHVAGGLIHLLLVIAVIVIVVQLIQGRRL